MQRREIFYSGRVQGVGFRHTVVSIARRYQATGYVRNLPDGRVHLVVEGEESDVEAFLQEIAAEMAGYIRGVQSLSPPARGEFSTFEVRY